MNRRRALGVMLAIGASPMDAFAQASGVPHVAILILASAQSVSTALDGFRATLRDLGHVDGRSIKIDVVSAEGQAERLPALAAQLVAQKPAVIVTGGGNVSTLAARKATTTIPIVTMSSINAVESGLVASLARPGGNVTGLTTPLDIGFKQIQLLRELKPSLSHLAVLVREDPVLVPTRNNMRSFAQEYLRVTLDFHEVRSPEDMPRALESLRATKPEALLVSPDPMMYQERGQIVRFARSARLPDMYSFPDIVDEGGLIAYSPSAREMAQGVARFVDRLLKGAKAADLPVEQISHYDLGINLGSAAALGLTVPQSLLARAERVVR